MLALLFFVGLRVGGALRRLGVALRLIQFMLALLFFVGLRVGGALWRLGVALRLIEFMLTLLVLVGLRVARIFGGTLRCVRLVACARERGPLVTLPRALRALLAVERKLFLANVCL